MKEHVSVVMVVGAGQMGTGIAMIAAENGYKVLLHDSISSRINESLHTIDVELARRLALNKIDKWEKARIFSRITVVEHLNESVHADFIIEAVTENLTIKKQIFTSLAGYITQQTILATNTSSLPITDIASATDCPEKVIGLHFMNPVAEIALVEVIRGAKTSDSTTGITREIAGSLGKEAVEVKDYPGFVSNRLLMPMINEAITCVFDGVADIETIDRIMRLGRNHPIGPLRLADIIGLDTCLTVLETLHRGLDNRKYRPCTLLRNMVKAGKLGCKAGQGFYIYDN